MNILVDTSIWSLAFRKKTLSPGEAQQVTELKELIYEKRIIMLGPIRQELLSGIRSLNTFEVLRHKMAAFEDEMITTPDYEKAAEIHNLCRSKGIQGSHIDFLITAFAVNRNMALFTTDKDFDNYASFVKLKLHQIRDEIKE